MNEFNKCLKLLLCGILTFIATVTNAQIKTDSIELLQLKNYIQSNLKIEADRVIIPSHQNYQFRILGTDNPYIIDNKGNIHQPLITKKVNLLLEANHSKKSEALEVPIQNIIIKGKNSHSGINPKPFVIPSLREWFGYEGNFKITKKSKIVIPSNDQNLKQVAELLQKDLIKQFGINLEIKVLKKPSEGDFFITNDAETLLGNEGYKINIEKFVHISAPAYNGKVFATRTILQILEQSKSEHTLPKGIIRDYPTYAERGFMLDVGRKFFTIDFLNDYVELLSYYKISNFQIHLNDNTFHKYFEFDWDKTPSGFRLENDTYPNLASKDGHYSKKEFIQLQEKALRYGIKIIPEIDVPAHSLAISKAIPEIASDKYGKDHLDLSNPKTFEVVKNIFEEYIKGDNPVFIGDEVHIGTDEYDKKEAETFRKFTDDLIKLVQSHGKSVRAWGALTHAKGTTPVTTENVTLNMWYNGYADPIEMKKLGYKQISTPDGWLYIVPAAGYYYDYLNTDNIYNKWEPRKVGQVVFEKGDPTIVGGMFAVWNDIAGNGISEKDVHNRVFPALQILSEKMWTAEDENISLFEFNSNKKNISEGPGLNMRGYFGENPKKLIDLSFNQSLDNSSNYLKEKISASNAKYIKGIKDYALQSIDNTLNLPIEEIGQEYTISFWLKNNQPNGKILFQSKNASFEINASLIKYQRDGYDYEVVNEIDLKSWRFITITGNKEKVNLYIDGKLVKKMETEKIILPYKDQSNKEVFYNKVKSLTFPLRKIRSINIDLDEFKVINKELNKDEVLNEYLQFNN